MNWTLLPLRVHGEQTACEELEDVFEDGSVSGSERMISNGPVTKREKGGLVLASETWRVVGRPLLQPVVQAKYVVNVFGK